MNVSSCQASCVLLSQQTAGASSNVITTTGGSSSTVIGTLFLRQETAGDGAVRITGTLSNLSPGKHGLSVGVAGDLSRGAASCGPTFNPFGKTHGAPGDEQRMVGDLGNIVVDATGNCTVDITDKTVQLVGPHSVLGRSLLIAAGEDDQGRGGHENSLSTGNAGPRIAAGVIGLALPTTAASAQ